MQHIWAPWRGEYIQIKKASHNKEPVCFLCASKDEKVSEKTLILYKSKHSYVIMNRYPYNNGHLMVSPFIHKSNLFELTDEIMSDLFKTLAYATKIVKEIFECESMNIGINIGKAAGAGEEHLHIHIVPRFYGDTNFMPVFSETKVLSEHLVTTYNKLKEHFK